MLTKKIITLSIFAGLALSQIIYYSPSIIRNIIPTSFVNVTKAELNQIKNGMTYNKVTEIIGGNGKKVTDIAYRYNGDSSLDGKDVELVFEDGKVCFIIWDIEKTVSSN